MVTAKFEHDGNVGLLYIKTHFGHNHQISCEKSDDEVFRLGGTAANDVLVYEGLITELSDPICNFKAFRKPEDVFEGVAHISPEAWSSADLHCYITEYYSLEMEGKDHEWFVSKGPIKDANYLFVNLDVLDGGGNLIRRYRVSPFTGEHKLI
jgi:hypothetical protein